MEIKKYNGMMKWLTRPGAPAQKEDMNKKNDMERYVKNINANNKNPGTFQKLVKETEQNTHTVKTLNKFEDRADIKDDGPDILRNMLIEEMNRRELDRDEIRYLMDTKDRSQLKKEKIEPKNQTILKSKNPYPTQATPEQVGQLAERLERNAQMTGSKGPFTKIADNLGKNKPKPKPIVKKDPVTNYTDFKIDPIISDPYSALPPEPNDPYLDQLEARVKANQELNYQEKVRNNSSGLRFFDPIEVKRDD